MTNASDNASSVSNTSSVRVERYIKKTSKPSLLYTTFSPCLTCASIILNCEKIIGVIFNDKYRDDTGLILITAHRMVLHTTDLFDKCSAEIKRTIISFKNNKC